MAQPLEGVTVLDLTQIYNGPYATFLMAMAGANVIKIEPPGGEHLRKRQGVSGAAMPFAMLNANKRTMTLDLKTERGRVDDVLALTEATLLSQGGRNVEETYYYRGRALLATGDAAGARAAFRRVVALNPDSAVGRAAAAALAGL